MYRSLRAVPPDPCGTGTVDHTGFSIILEALATDGLEGLTEYRSPLAVYIAHLEAVEPDSLDRSEALAFWLNLYNASSLQLVTEASTAELSSVLRTAGVFHGKRVTVATEALSLDGIEHGKLRRFRDPRIHAALVCGSVSCPTLRGEPFTGPVLDRQLNEQMRTFLASGGAEVSESGDEVTLSKVFKLYGGEFTHPDAMPTLKQAKRWEILAAIKKWMDQESVGRLVDRPSIKFQDYDWSLACNIG